jgi:protein-tyrosine phosphatase
LPGLDDGVQEESEYIELLNLYQKNGITEIVFTPHINHPGINYSVEKIKQTYQKYKSYAEDRGIKTHLGCELYLTPDYKDFIAIDDRFILIEFPTNVYPTYLLDTIFDLQLDGYEIIIAHVERYSWLEEKKELINKLKEMGIYFQVNLSATERKEARYYLDNDYVEFIATDNHGKRREVPNLSLFNNYNDIMKKSFQIMK